MMNTAFELFSSTNLRSRDGVDQFVGCVFETNMAQYFDLPVRFSEVVTAAMAESTGTWSTR